MKDLQTKKATSSEAVANAPDALNSCWLVWALTFHL